MAEKAVEARISGRVQGVNFRAWTQEQAEARGLRGWVLNNPDGSVEAVFAGPSGTVDEMLDLCRQGPAVARVDSVETRDLAEDPGVARFEVRR